MTTTHYIQTSEALSEYCSSLPGEAVLYIDTEFMRERTYHASLCLMQIRADAHIALIDTVVVEDLQPLWAVLARSHVVLHSGRQDLEVIYVAAKLLPDTLFDTQVAAGLCGKPAQMGYASLVAELTGVELDKAHTRENWARRPMAAAALEYAADDVRYLPEVHQKLLDDLRNLGRLDWAIADSKDLLDTKLYATQTDQAWRRLRGLGRLAPTEQQRAAQLADWREQTALVKNLPRQWVLKDAELLALAALAQPTAKDVAEHVESPGNVRRYQDEILQCLTKAPRETTALVSNRRPDASEKALTKALAAIVTETAQELAIETEILAPMREMRSLASGERNVRVLQGWRAPLLADKLLACCEDAP